MLKVEISVPSAFTFEMADKVMMDFVAEAGPIAVEGVQELLGTADLGLRLSASYREMKIRGEIEGMVRIPGKDEDQPGILTADLYHGVSFTPTESEGLEPFLGFTVGVAEGAGIAPDGDDYAEKIEQETQFLERGVQSKEPQMQHVLESVLARVIAEATA